MCAFPTGWHIRHGRADSLRVEQAIGKEPQRGRRFGVWGCVQTRAV